MCREATFVSSQILAIETLRRSRSFLNCSQNNSIRSVSVRKHSNRPATAGSPKNRTRNLSKSKPRLGETHSCYIDQATKRSRHLSRVISISCGKDTTENNHVAEPVQITDEVIFPFEGWQPRSSPLWNAPRIGFQIGQHSTTSASKASSRQSMKLRHNRDVNSPTRHRLLV
jgi:hypothetical protein